MSAHNEQPVNNWWAEGDTPVHADSHVTYLVDAHSAGEQNDQQNREQKRIRHPPLREPHRERQHPIEHAVTLSSGGPGSIRV